MMGKSNKEDRTKNSSGFEEVSQCVERLQLGFQTQVRKGAAGEMAGAGAGASMDFQDHRSYVPGDDPRHINWQAYARTGQYSMKLYREEVRPLVDLIIDASPSMFYEDEKAKRSRQLVQLSFLLAHKSGADTKVFLVSPEGCQLLSNEEVHQQAWETRVEDVLGSSSQAPQLEHLPLRPTSMRLLVSDCLFDGDPKQLLRPLGRGQGNAALLVPFSRDESHPEWDGNYDFTDAEDHSQHSHRIEPHVLKRYKKTYQNHFQQWRSASQSQQFPFCHIPSSGSLLESLQASAISQGVFSYST